MMMEDEAAEFDFGEADFLSPEQREEMQQHFEDPGLTNPAMPVVDGDSTSSTSASPPVKVKKPPRKKKDPNAPASVSSAYAFFFKETQASVKTHNPNAKFGEVSKIVASMWEALGEEDKSAFRKKNEEDKIRFEREIAEYKAKGGGGNHGLISEPKKEPPPSVSVQQQKSVAEEDSFAEDDESRCIREGCSRKAVRNPEWEDEYCSNQCVVLHCGNVFADWVLAGGVS